MKRVSLLPAPQVCERVRARGDAAWDGLLFIAVTSTGIFCRPTCPAPAARADHVRYFASPAAALAAGFCPCLRCHPEAAVPAPPWHGGDALMAAMSRRVAERLPEPDLAACLPEMLGVTAAELDRRCATAVGVTAAQYVSAQRLLLAGRLVAAAWPRAAVAQACGYRNAAALRRTLLRVYGHTLRPRSRARPQHGPIVLHLPWRAPCDIAATLVFLARRVAAGIEQVDEHGYRRLFAYAGSTGWVQAQPCTDRSALEVRIQHSDPRAFAPVLARITRLFDLDAVPTLTARALRHDAQLRRMLRAFPGVRVPGAWDGFEIAVRAILGQQISVTGAGTLMRRLIERFGTPMPPVDGMDWRAFPTPAVLAAADLAGIGLTHARARTLSTMAAAVASGRVDFIGQHGLAAFVAMWTALPGIGPWTAHYIAMRVLRHPDAFPAADLGLRRMAGGVKPLSVRDVERRGEGWRPWRAYATRLIWRAES